MGSNPHQNATFTDRLAHSFQISVLEISQPPMNNLVQVRRSRAAKIALLYQGYGESSQGCIPRNTNTVYPATYNGEIILPLGQTR
jgi:hypothetical protein